MGFRLTRMKVIAGVLTFAALSLVIAVTAVNMLIVSFTRDRIYTEIQSVPYNKVGLLLGTSKYSMTGGVNDHYRLRLQAAYDLFMAKRIGYILISGDNATPHYNEPTTIKKDLLKMGVPEERIYRDYAGFRTWDSIVRANRIFNLSRLTVISQGYLNNRALYIAIKQGVDAVAYNAGAGDKSDLSNRGREVLARVLAFFEVHIFHTEPSQMEGSVHIGDTPPT